MGDIDFTFLKKRVRQERNTRDETISTELTVTPINFNSEIIGPICQSSTEFVNSCYQ